MIMKIQGDHIHDFFTDPVYENLLDYLNDSAVPSSSPAAAGQDPQEQWPSAPVGNYAGTQSIELAVRTWGKHQRQRSTVQLRDKSPC